MYWIEPLPGGTTQHRQGKPRQAKATRAKGTDDLHWVWLVPGWGCCQQAWWPCTSSTLDWSCSLACHSQLCPWLCKAHFGGYLLAREARSISRSKLNLYKLKTLSWFRKLPRGAKGLLHIHLNFLASQITRPLNFLFAYIFRQTCGKKMQRLIFLIQGILLRCLDSIEGLTPDSRPGPPLEGKGL